MKPFIYAHELLNPGGIWLGCDDEKSVRDAYTEGETGCDIIALYHENDYKDQVDKVNVLKMELKQAHRMIKMLQGLQ